MKFKRTGNVAISDCGNYEIRASYFVDGKPFYNAWYLPDDKHVGASLKKAEVKQACEEHFEKASRGTKAA